MRLNHLLSAGRVNAVDAVGAAIAVAATLALIFGVIGPVRAHNRQIAAHFQTAARERQRMAVVVTETRSVAKDVSNMRAQIAASSLHILAPDALNQRLADLTGLSGACGLAVADLKPGSRAQAARFTAIPVRMTGRGTYRSCAAFIHLLHERLPDISVCSFKLTGTPEIPGSAGNFDLNLLWLASPQAAPASHLTTAALP